MATSGDDLVLKLHGNPSFIFTLIQKFNKPNAKPIYPDHDILIMSDEGPPPTAANMAFMLTIWCICCPLHPELVSLERHCFPTIT